MLIKLHREVVVYPGFDKRHTDPKKNYGVHGCEVVFYVHDTRKSRWVQFKLYTCWLPRHTQEEHHYKDTHVGIQPMGADLGYHSPKPLYKGQRRMECSLRGGFCYYDGSSLAADRLRDLMLVEGSDAIWRELEAEWHDTFDPKPKKASRV